MEAYIVNSIKPYICIYGLNPSLPFSPGLLFIACDVKELIN